MRGQNKERRIHLTLYHQSPVPHNRHIPLASIEPFARIHEESLTSRGGCLDEVQHRLSHLKGRWPVLQWGCALRREKVLSIQAIQDIR